MKPLASLCDREEVDNSIFTPPTPMEPPPVSQRYVYQVDRSNRLIGLAGTLGIYALVLAAFFFTVTHVVPVKQPSTLTVFDVKPPASPQETPPKEKEAPKPIEKKETPQQPVKIERVPPTKFPISTVTVPVAAEMPKPADPTPKQPETAAPKNNACAAGTAGIQQRS